jgi:hypothetical protein
VRVPLEAWACLSADAHAQLVFIRAVIATNREREGEGGKVVHNRRFRGIGPERQTPGQVD